MNIRDNPQLCDKLAAEYVLGTLRGGARRRFERYLRDDAVLQRLTAEWQERLMPMAEFTGAQTPRAQVWRAIERRLGLGQAQKRVQQRAHAVWQFWRTESLTFWRSLSLVSLAAALLMGGVLRSTLVEAPQVDLVATLIDDKARTALLLTADSERRVFTARLVENAPVAADKSLQLWAVPKEGAPRSLGVIPPEGAIELPLTGSAIGDDIATLAVSLEPRGGSPGAGGPTGPILYKGNWVRML